MTHRSSSDIDIASKALVMAGAKEINSFEDQTREANVARLLYEDTAAAALTQTPWRWAIKQVELSQLVAPPVGRGESSWQVPTDCLLVQAVTVDQTPLEFERYEDTVVLKHGVNDNSVVVMEYISRVDTSEFSPMFVLGLEHMLAAPLSIALGQNEQLANWHAQKAGEIFETARRTDAQGRTNSVMQTKRLISVRR